MRAAATRAFSSEVDSGSRQENVLKQKTRAAGAVLSPAGVFLLAIMLPKVSGTSIKLPSIARTRGRVCMKSIDLLSGILGSMHACGFMRAH
jgi:hypothetical protein